MKLFKEIANWIRTQVEKAGKKGIVFGLSGGLDSAVLAAIANPAVGDNALALILPCESDPRDIELALKVAKKFNVKTIEIALDNLFNEFLKLYREANSLAKANLKPRLRMAALYCFANTLGYLVAGASNKSELAIGYFTKHGDGGADILPLGGLLKREVRKLAADLEIPREIIERPPSAGLWEGQTDESELGITYNELDKTIVAIEKNRTKDVDKKILRKVKKMMTDSEHKRAKAPIFGGVR